MIMFMLFFVVCFLCVFLFLFFFFFFFSSRRRHTRLVSDWSSDVCSSDLFVACTRQRSREASHPTNCQACVTAWGPWSTITWRICSSTPGAALGSKIGRASCRERV